MSQEPDNLFGRSPSAERTNEPTSAIEDLLDTVADPKSFAAFLKEQGIHVEGTNGRQKRFLDSLPAYRYVRWEPKGVDVNGASVEIRTCEGKLYMFLTKEAFDASFG